MSPSTSTNSTSQVPTFDSLGVRTIVNCMGTYTIITGSRLIPQAAEAMVEASNHYVQLDELMDKVGERLAELTGAEWGYITSGCASALAQVTAAAIAGGNPEQMLRLPDAAGLCNEVIVQERHRNAYDYAMRMTGARMVEVTTEADLETAFSDRTALVAIVGDLEERSTIPAPTIIDAAKAHGIPTLVDAAAQRPNVPNRYLQMGADVVLYSGGKCLRGPQAAGLALGNKALLKAAFLNGAPHHAIGRTMKAGKEEIMGLLAAVEAYITGRDHEAEWRMWEGFLETIRAAIADLPTLETEIIQPGMANNAPQLKISWDPDVLYCTPEQAHQELWDGEPRVALHLLPDGLRVMPYMMELGDDAVAARRLSEVLRDRQPVAAETVVDAAPVDVSGQWRIHNDYVYGSSDHSALIEQNGQQLTGEYQGQFDRVPLSGQVVGDAVEFGITLGCQINRVRYTYRGTLRDGVLSGEVSLGEFGSAQWTANR